MARSLLVGQVGNLRPIVNRPVRTRSYSEETADAQSAPPPQDSNRLSKLVCRILDAQRVSRRHILPIIWCCFLARSLFYSTAIPIWEGYDEYAHFALIQYVANHHGYFPMGAAAPNQSRAVTESRRLTPGAGILKDDRAEILSYEQHFSLSAAQRQERRSRLENLPLAWSHEESLSQAPLYEAQQPPLYYWLMAPLYKAAETWSIPHIVWLLRCFAVLIASAVVPITFWTARLVLRSEILAIGAALITTLFPEFIISVSTISNQVLAIAAASAFVLLALHTLRATPSLRAGAWTGIMLGVALLTKAYCLALVPLAVTVLCASWVINKDSRSRAVWQAVAAVGASFSIAGWWYFRNLVVTGTLTGQFEDVQASSHSTVSFFSAITQIHWQRVLDFLAITHIWLGSWSFLVLRSWMYRTVELLLLAALAGVCAHILRNWSDLPSRKDLLLLLLPYAAMVLGLCFHAAQVFRASGHAGTVGYYLYALVTPESILLVTGIAALLATRARLQTIPLISAVLIALEGFGAWFLLFPYYAGLIQHNAHGGLPAANILDLSRAIAGDFWIRLTSVGPSSSAAAVATAAALYAVATLVLLWVIYTISISGAINAAPARQKTRKLRATIPVSFTGTS